MNRYVMKVHRSPCEGHLGFMVDLYRMYSDDPCLKHAIISVSYQTLSVATGHQQYHIDARKNYGLSLGHLNKALGRRENIAKDQVLASCLLLSMFYVSSWRIISRKSLILRQNIVHEGNGLRDPHLSGVCNLMHLRDESQVRSKYTRDFLGWIIVQVVSDFSGPFALSPSS